MTTNTLLLVGHGKMGSALLQGWRKQLSFSEIHVISPHHTQADDGTLHWHRNLETLPTKYTPSVITFAVKPALLAEILPQYAQRFSTTPLYLSIAAGKTLSFYHKHLGTHAHIVRAMPNTPSLIGQGMTSLCAENTLAASARKIATDLMNAIGKTCWLEESQMNAATAIAGCGPAYVFLFLDSLVKAGITSGLHEKDARALAIQTMIGTCALSTQSEKTFEDLIAQVASPGGATEAALTTLKTNNALEQLLNKAVQAAITRSAELGQ